MATYCPGSSIVQHRRRRGPLTVLSVKIFSNSPGVDEFGVCVPRRRSCSCRRLGSDGLFGGYKEFRVHYTNLAVKAHVRPATRTDIRTDGAAEACEGPASGSSPYWQLWKYVSEHSCGICGRNFESVVVSDQLVV